MDMVRSIDHYSWQRELLHNLLLIKMNQILIWIESRLHTHLLIGSARVVSHRLKGTMFGKWVARTAPLSHTQARRQSKFDPSARVVAYHMQSIHN